MEFRILGPLDVRDQGRPIVLTAAKQRALLVLLLLGANESMSTDRIVDRLWDGRPPASARKVVQTYVSKLRRVVGASALLTGPAGYELRVEPDQLDVHRFERLVVQARAAEPRDAAELLRRALAVWRGPALADLRDEPFAQAEIIRLEEMRLAVVEQRVEVDLALGRHTELVPELRRLLAEHPLRERMRAQLMIALYRSGRQADALDVHGEGRRHLVDELGLEPGAELRGLERAILRQDPRLELPVGSSPVAHPSPVQRARALPTPGTSFVGRAQELEVIEALLTGPDVRLLTLTGPGGAGKTRLAVEAAGRVRGRFRHGVVFVDLAAVRDAALVLKTIADVLGLREATPRSAVTEVAQYLRAREILLVVDNVEQVLAAASYLTDLLAAAPAIKTLVTSRVPLHVGEEHVFSVPPLPLPVAGAGPAGLAEVDAVALFVDRASSARPGFALTEANVHQVAELCVHLDGLPLALELAAARLALLSPSAVLARLGRRLDLLRSPAPDAAQRHRTLRAAIEWSHELLDPPERALFAALSVFVGGFTVEAAEAVAGGDLGDLGDRDVVQGVETLLGANLLRAQGVVADEPRFGMLETIREYALDRTGRAGRQAELRDRHARWCLALVERAEPQLRGPDQGRWLERLDAEHDDLRAALTWAGEDGDADTGLRTGAALWRFWQVRGLVDEGRTRLEGLLDTGRGSAGARAAAHLTVARCAFVQGDLPTLRRFVAAGVPVYRAQGDAHALGFALMILGASAGTRGEHVRGVALLQESLDVAGRAGDRWLSASCHGYLGIVLSRNGDLVAGRDELEEGLRGARRLGDHRCVGWMLISLARIARVAGHRDRARELVTEATAVQQRLGDVWGVTNALRENAALALDDGDRPGARAHLATSLALAWDIHDRPGVAAALDQLADLAADDGSPRRAARLLGCVGALDETIHDPWRGPAVADERNSVVKTALGDDLFVREWTAGRGMTADEAVAFALEDDEPAHVV